MWPKPRWSWCGFAALLLVLSFASVSAAQDEGTLRLMREPTAFTDAIDAFDDDDAFDANLHVGFERRRTAGTIQREMGTGTARDSANWTDIGEWEHVRNELVLGADIGVYRDLMIFARFPLVLSDTREVLYPDGVTPATVDTELQEPAIGGDAALYNMPFISPTRSGVDTLNLGTAFNVLNQARRPEFPTWMMLFEFRLGIGDIMNACEKVPMSTCNAGVSRGTHAFRFESRMSRRYRYAEVYSGMLFHFEWAGRAESQFSPSGSLSGYQNVRPPIQGTFTAGIAFIPWENRQAWQRFTVDLRLQGTYVSEGRDYSPLFDALGSSQHPALAIDNLEGRPGPGGAVGDLRRVPFTGLTDVQAHGKIGGTIAIEMQAARYVRFRFGLDVQYITEHVITFADGCNPNADVANMTDVRACDFNSSTGQVADLDGGLLNPHHRPVIDRAGNRFRLDGAVDLNLFVGASAQF